MDTEKTYELPETDVTDAPIESADAAAEECTSAADCPDAADAAEEQSIIIPRKDGLMPMTLLGAILGMLVGTIPGTAAAYLFGGTYAFLFLAVPLCIYGGITLCHGCRDRRAIIVTVIFSLIGGYLLLLGCDAAAHTATHDQSLFSIPLVTILYIGRENIFRTMTASSIYILIFLVMGCYTAAELFLGVQPKKNGTN